MELLDTTGAPLDAEAVEQDFAALMSAPPKAEADKLDLPPKPAKEAAKAPAAKKPAARTQTKAAAPKAQAAVSGPETDAKRAEAGASLFHTAAMGATLAGRFTGVEAFNADAQVLVANADPFGLACAELAKANKSFAKFLDTESAVGAYLMFGSVCLGVSVQIAQNHGILRSAPAEIPADATPEQG